MERMCRPMAASQYDALYRMLEEEETKVETKYIPKGRLFEPTSPSTRKGIEAQLTIWLALQSQTFDRDGLPWYMEQRGKPLPESVSALLTKREALIMEEIFNRKEFEMLAMYKAEDYDCTIDYTITEGKSQQFCVDRKLLKNIAYFDLYPEVTAFTFQIPQISEKEFNAFLWELSGTPTNLGFDAFSRIVLYLDAPEMEKVCIERFAPFFSTEEIIEHAQNVPFLLPFAFMRIDEWKENHGKLPPGVTPAIALGFMQNLARAEAFSWPSSRVLNYLYKRNKHIAGQEYSESIQKVLVANVANMEWRRQDNGDQTLLLPQERKRSRYVSAEVDAELDTANLNSNIIIYWDNKAYEWDIKQQEEPSANASVKDIQDYIHALVSRKLNKENPWVILDPSASKSDRVWVARTQEGNKPVTIYWDKKWKCELPGKAVA